MADGTKIAEWIVSSGLVVASIGGFIWIGTIDERVSTVKTTVDGLDNAVLGNRITKLETKVEISGQVQNDMDKKIDRLLERSARWRDREPAREP